MPRYLAFKYKFPFPWQKMILAMQKTQESLMLQAVATQGRCTGSLALETYDEHFLFPSFLFFFSANKFVLRSELCIQQI